MNELKSKTNWHVIRRWAHTEWTHFAKPARGIAVQLRISRVRDRKLLRASARATAADRALREQRRMQMNTHGDTPEARERTNMHSVPRTESGSKLDRG